MVFYFLFNRRNGLEYESFIGHNMKKMITRLLVIMWFPTFDENKWHAKYQYGNCIRIVTGF